jgi:hypothetical protein
LVRGVTVRDQFANKDAMFSRKSYYEDKEVAHYPNFSADYLGNLSLIGKVVASLVVIHFTTKVTGAAFAFVADSTA